ncbi:helix-turn-helix domain-containing protein [Mucilaginibacter antarcticus]|uniref:Helix-turn-helix domain-containing protein n=1 Tax=Mucilaginibacter antarcticus TaxID=1855725 RepID=A0ABW5XLI0_9SPHI
MKLYIKNMVCRRCVTAVQQVFADAGIVPTEITLGEVELATELAADEVEGLNTSLHKLGFEIIDDRKSRIIEHIKKLIIKVVHHSKEPLDINLSDYLSSQMNYEYNYLSNLFSEVEGNTIEKFFISQKIEKVKELLIYDELTLGQIAFQLGYSSVAYLSTQFKKVTGLTPGYFKSIKLNKRAYIDDL